MIASTLSRRNGEIALKALSLGARDCIAKPGAGQGLAADGRVASLYDFDAIRKMIVGPLSAIMRPVLKSPRSSTLGPLERGPFYAVEVHASALGTVGGPVTDAKGRVLTTEGAVVPGLYSAGNAGGAATQGFYAGAGGTIALGLVFGHITGREAAATPVKN